MPFPVVCEHYTVALGETRADGKYRPGLRWYCPAPAEPGTTRCTNHRGTVTGQDAREAEWMASTAR